MLKIFILAFLLSTVLSIHLSHENSRGGVTWEHFKSNFGQHIQHQHEQYRKHIFEHNLAKIEAHNADHTQSYKMGVNHFTIFTQKQFEHMFLSHLNIVPKSIKLAHFVRKQNKQMHMDIDWVSQGKVGPVKNQGGCQSSWAFAAIGSVEALFSSEDMIINLSVQQLVDCSGEYGNNACTDGWPQKGLIYIKNKGITTQQALPYAARKQSCKVQEGEYKITGIQTYKSCDKIKEVLMSKPIAVSVDAFNWSPYKSGVFNSCKKSINHHVLVVGIIDDIWKVKNSWGSKWGEDGYIRLASGNTCAICNLGVSPTI